MKENHAKHIFKKKTRRSSGDHRWGRDKHRKLNRVKDEFISLLTHELLSPLTSIMCISEILRDTDVKPCQLRHFIDIIIHESERLNGLVDQVLCIWNDMIQEEAHSGQRRIDPIGENGHGGPVENRGDLPAAAVYP